VKFTIAGHTGYNGTVSFSSGSCTGLPRESKCSFNPASVTGNGSTTLTISTTAPTSAALLTGFDSDRFAWFATGFATMAGVLLFGVPRRKRFVSACCVLAVVSLATIVGCGGSSSGGGGSGDPGTLRGSYAVTVTASSGGLSHVVSLTLNVQ
jgi:trimeric autotransporter adhesin